MCTLLHFSRRAWQRSLSSPLLLSGIGIGVAMVTLLHFSRGERQRSWSPHPLPSGIWMGLAIGIGVAIVTLLHFSRGEMQRSWSYPPLLSRVWSRPPPPYFQNDGRNVAMPLPLEINSCGLLEFRMLESSLAAPLLGKWRRCGHGHPHPSSIRKVGK